MESSSLMEVTSVPSTDEKIKERVPTLIRVLRKRAADAPAAFMVKRSRGAAGELIPFEWFKSQAQPVLEEDTHANIIDYRPLRAQIEDFLDADRKQDDERTVCNGVPLARLDEVYDFYRAAEGAGNVELDEGCEVFYEDAHESDDTFSEEDSNAEDYFANDYPNESDSSEEANEAEPIDYDELEAGFEDMILDNGDEHFDI